MNIREEEMGRWQYKKDRVFLERIRAAIDNSEWLREGETLLVAVSGGADSVCLLHALHELAPDMGIELVAVHLNHRIRGTAADEDAAFVAETAQRLGVPYRIGACNVPGKARREGVSLEMAARDARYRFFARVAQKCGATAVATAHTQDDQAETVLLKLARGAGPGGLSGILPDTAIHGLRVLRPMLSIDRPEVLRYLHDRGIAWREDESNRDTGFLRNRVRHELLPVLAQTLNPGIKDVLARTGDILREEDAWLNTLAAAILADCRMPGGGRPPALDLSRWGTHPPAARRRVLRLWLHAAGLPGEEADFAAVGRLEQLCSKRRGTRAVPVGSGWLARREYGTLRLEQTPAVPPAFRRALEVPGETLLLHPPLRIVVERGVGVAKPRGTHPGELPARASLGTAAVGRKRLYVRSRRPGDRIGPLGMTGSRKLQDVFVDAKVPVALRDTVPVIECGGEIVWLPGYRVARGWEVKHPDRPALQLAIERV